MASFRLSELPTPGVTVGFPAGCTLSEGGPTPPTPTGKVYFSGTTDQGESFPGGFTYQYDPSSFDNIADFIAKGEGDTVSITFKEVASEMEITNKDVETEDDVTYTEFTIGTGLGGSFSVGFETSGGVTTCYVVEAQTHDEAPESATLVIADPS